MIRGVYACSYLSFTPATRLYGFYLTEKANQKFLPFQSLCFLPNLQSEICSGVFQYNWTVTG